MGTKYEQKRKENKHNYKVNLLNDQYSLSLSLSSSLLSLSDLIFVIFPQWPCFHFVI